MRMEVEYSRKEVEDMVLKLHIAQFGPAPTGLQWYSSLNTYGTAVKVTLIEKEEEEVKENDSPDVAGTTEPGTKEPLPF